MDKVTVSKEVMDAFLNFVDNNMHKENRIMYWIENRDEFTGNYKGIRDIDLDTFIALLYGNYEVEISVDEMVMDIYNQKNDYSKGVPIPFDANDAINRILAEGFTEGVKYMNDMYKLGLNFDGDTVE